MSKVTVVTPIYNSERFLDKAIESVFEQSFSDWEMVAVDDCSSDGSAELVRRYAERDSRVRLIQLDKNSGAAVARNVAIEEAKGRYIAFLDSDDLWLPEKLEKHIDFIEETGAALSYTAYEKITEAGERTGVVVTPPESLTYDDLLKSNRIGCLTAIYDTKKIGKVTMPLIRKRQDYGLWLKILRDSGPAIGLCEPLSLYREREGSISSNKVEMVKYHWSLFRDIEGLSRVKSAYYLSCNIWNKVLRG
ncbi:glycosyltransferase family 2 protein [Halomonas salifodinae]|uniref:glycosyltransferase family 2 protein n=1 Tax=Halomonas salifodinae TaxID=438745 RepID=UPI0033B1F020